MKILSLQGGGMLGKGQAVILRELEADWGTRPLHTVFDLVAGTSVGAILGAAVACDLPMAKVVSFFDLDGPKIFARNLFSGVAPLFGARYSAAPVEEALRNLFGDRTLADCKTCFICTAFDASFGRNVYFQSYGAPVICPEEIVVTPGFASEIPLWQILMASSAAQTYFPAMEMLGLTLIDGGNTGQNAPDILALCEAMGPDLRSPGGPRCQMLSLGSGQIRWNNARMENPGLLRAARGTIAALFRGGEESSVWQAAQWLGGDHCRLSPDLGEGYALDDASHKTLGILEQAALESIARHPELLRPFLPL